MVAGFSALQNPITENLRPFRSKRVNIFFREPSLTHGLSIKCLKMQSVFTSPSENSQKLNAFSLLLGSCKIRPGATELPTQVSY